MTNRAMRAGFLAFALLGAACGDSEANTTRREAAGEGPGIALLIPTPSEVEVAPTAATLPIPEDFEHEMAETVTPENYRVQLELVLDELDPS